MNRSTQSMCCVMHSHRDAAKFRLILCGATAASIACFSTLADAHDITIGSEDTANFVCDSSVRWDTVRSVTLGVFTHAHNCVINASADLSNPSGDTADQLYHISVSMDTTSPALDNSTARTVELRGQSKINDPGRWPVSTTSRVVAGANAPHTFLLLCRKNNGTNPNLIIVDSGINVVCLQQ